MCHPWLAAGVTAFIAVIAVREFGPVLREPSVFGLGEGQGLIGAGPRAWLRSRIDPLVEMLAAAHLSPDVVTAAQFVANALAGAAYGMGWIFTGGWLLIAGGTLDVIDGTLARRRGAASPRGAFLDSVADRYGECLVFAGLAWCVRDGLGLLVVLGAFSGAFLVSYARARAEGLGVECRLGILQRPERYVILGLGSLLAALVAHLICNLAAGRAVLLASVAVVAVLAHATAIERAAFTLRRLP